MEAVDWCHTATSVDYSHMPQIQRLQTTQFHQEYRLQPSTINFLLNDEKHGINLNDIICYCELTGFGSLILIIAFDVSPRSFHLTYTCTLSRDLRLHHLYRVLLIALGRLVCLIRFGLTTLIRIWVLYAKYKNRRPFIFSNDPILPVSQSIAHSNL